MTTTTLVGSRPESASRRGTSIPAPARAMLVSLAVTILASASLLAVAVTAGTALPMLMGLRTMVVTSGSMEPAIGVGAALLVEPLSPDSVDIGDLISFQSPDGGTMTTHRVVAIKEIKNELYFQTQGDANEEPDANLAPGGAVAGRVRAVLPFFGYVLVHTSSPLARLGLLAVPIMVLVALELRSLLGARKSV